MIWHSQSVENVLKELHTDSNSGLSEIVASERLEKFGKNTTSNKTRNIFWSTLKKHLFSVGSVLLYILALIYLIVGLIAQNFSLYFPSLLVSLVVIKALLLSFCVYKTKRDSIKVVQSSSPKVKVLRSSETVVISSNELVQGDIIFLETGDLVPADCRIVESEFLLCDESTFGKTEALSEKFATGEELPDFAQIGDRYNMLFSGTSIMNGKVKAVVTETGNKTEIAKKEALCNNPTFIDDIVARYEDLFRIVKTGTIVALSVVFILGVILSPKPNGFWKCFLDTLSVILSAATIIIPPFIEDVFSIITTLGLKRISKNDAIILKPDSISNISNIDVICSDKTGIITRNAMGLSAIYCNDTLYDADLLDTTHSSVMMLSLLGCTSVTTKDGKTVGEDPTEYAIVSAAESLLGATKQEYDGMYPSIISIPFDKENMLKATVNMIDNKIYMIIKGTPESLLDRCIGCNREAILEANKEMSEKAMRVLAVAFKKLDEIPAVISTDLLEGGFSFVTLLGLTDRVRKHVLSDVKKCADAGISTVMFTGDNINTASAIAVKSGIDVAENNGITAEQLANLSDEELANTVNDTFVYSGINPTGKARIINAMSQNGSLVAVTGDSTDDILPLRTATVGFAIGENCTASAKGSADALIKDGRFSTIVNTICECRGIIDNARKAIQGSLMLTSFVLTTLLLGFIIFGQSLFSNAQVLFLAAISSLFQIFCFALEPAEDDILCTNFRKKVLDSIGQGVDKNMFIYGLVAAIFVNLSFMLGNSLLVGSGHNCALITFAFAHVGVLLSIKTNSGTLNKNIVRNMKKSAGMLIASAIYLAIVSIAAFTPLSAVISNGINTFVIVPISLAAGILTFAICDIIKSKAYK